ncbi:hypothetical protein AV530_009702 [Patagioenas fasciata monilis]|uniref:Uncharacterized protein n=1 Tax=Patagioenas fasciata monilis TaxID=372326 RepID=A0A1V4KMS2_PATFA|nr:hypothetical protein AV530_009702 [Patagioenas fasciata monilis]
MRLTPVVLVVPGVFPGWEWWVRFLSGMCNATNVGSPSPCWQRRRTVPDVSVDARPSWDMSHKLEENLLFSGKFTDALQALMDWLYRAEPQLSEDVPVGGDRDLVSDLMDKHKVFQKELGKRASCIKMLKRSVRDLTRGSSSVDSQWLQRQVEELSARWELVCRLSVGKQARLEAALRQLNPQLPHHHGSPSFSPKTRG